MRHLAERVGDRFHCGVVLHTGRASLPFGEKYFAVPIDSLWASKGIRV
jgi:hypothetical protein